MLKEADIIKTLQSAFAPISGVVGIGDDAAVLPFNETESYVVTKDILVEHRHFRLTTTDAASLAHKALHVNLSDVAAMGAEPLFVLLGIALPANSDEVWVSQFLGSFAEACKKQSLILVGGDTTASERDLFISVTVIGKAKMKNLKFRRGAKTGDILCVAGALGEAHAGLVALETNAQSLDAVKAKLLRPLALCAEGVWLGAEAGVTAMMDVSDGLVVDVGRLLQASKTGAVIDVEALQTSSNLAEASAKLSIDARECMLVGGEDYALLLTVSPSNFEKLAKDFQEKFGYALTKLGVITDRKKLELREGGNPFLFPYKPYSHFGEL